jgi:hypothetical protein
MTSDQFVFWLNGYFEISQHLNLPRELNERQVEEIKNHLKLVLKKETPENNDKQLALFQHQ